MRYTVLAALAVSLTSTVAHAQYQEKWRSPANVKFAGCENTDADNAKEAVFYNDGGSSFTAYVAVVDGVTGVVEWSLNPKWHTILTTQLVDVNGDGRYEVLINGWPLVTDSLRWYLYGYGGVGVSEAPVTGQLPQLLKLDQSTPNPVKTTASLHYAIPRKCKVNLHIYDASGKLVRTLVEGDKVPGRYSLDWDGRTDAGTRLPAGSYVCVLDADGTNSTRKMVLLK